MILIAIFFACGIGWLQQLATLPDLHWGVALFPLLLFLHIAHRKAAPKVVKNLLLALLALGCGFFYGAWHAQMRLADSLPAHWQGRDIIISGTVAEMPRIHERGISFVFDVEDIHTPGAHVPAHIQLSVYRIADKSLFPVHAGERWQFTVRLKQPHGSINPYTPDFEAWALERNLRAFGYVHHKGNNLQLHAAAFSFQYAIEKLREKLRLHFQQELGTTAYGGILNALAIGDQASIPAGQWQIFTRTGVNHLMSISGLHITMLAGIMFWLIYTLWRRSAWLTLHLPARKAAALAALFTAFVYAQLAGYGVPAQRTVYMLGAMTATLLLSQRMQAGQMLAFALLVVLLLDPWAINAPGFWLSFGAVGLIFYTTAHRLESGHWLYEYGRMQWAMSIGLIPPLLAMFQQVSIVSPLANAIAIPVVSFLVTPLTLLGTLPMFEWCLHLALFILELLMQALEWLSQLPAAVWTQHAPPAWSIVLAMLGVLWLLLPKGFPLRQAGLLLLLPLFLLAPDVPPPGTLRLTIFDVGQGLAVAAQTRNHTLLYDTGPAFNSETNSGNRIIVPALRGMGIKQLDTLILTHDDADHTGGALSVLQALPVTRLLSSLPEDSPILAQSSQTERCDERQQWQWDGIQFSMLHPTAAHYDDARIRNNDLGCVLHIRAGAHSVLLAADIEKKSEKRLLQTYAAQLESTILVVPHHGSKTSSTADFVQAVRPEYAVISAGYRNAFGHPKAEVVARYHEIGSIILRSDRAGAVIFEMTGQHLKLEQYRLTHARYWHQSTQHDAQKEDSGMD